MKGGSFQPLEPSPTLFLGNKPRVRSIRFASGHDAEGLQGQGHVHFEEKLHDSVVMVTQESDSSFLVKVRAHLPPSPTLLSLPPPQRSLASRADASHLPESWLYRHVSVSFCALVTTSVKWEVVRSL